jgi:uncharacterized membrane-anchored protein
LAAIIENQRSNTMERQLYGTPTQARMSFRLQDAEWRAQPP